MSTITISSDGVEVIVECVVVVVEYDVIDVFMLN